MTTKSYQRSKELRRCTTQDYINRLIKLNATREPRSSLPLAEAFKQSVLFTKWMFNPEILDLPLSLERYAVCFEFAKGDHELTQLLYMQAYDCDGKMLNLDDVFNLDGSPDVTLDIIDLQVSQP